MIKKIKRYFIQGCISGLLMLNLLSLTYAQDFKDDISSRISAPAWFKDSPFYDLADDIESTRQANKKGLMVLFVTQGCSYCHIFIQKSLADPDIARTVQNNFDSVLMEIFDDREMVTPNNKIMPIKEFAKQEKIEFSPTLLFYNTSGKRTLKITGYQSPSRFKKIINYITEGHYVTESLRDHFNHYKLKPSPAFVNNKQSYKNIFSSSEKIFVKNHFPAKKPVVVVFEKTGCSECEQFYQNVLAKNKIKKLLSRFDIINLDIDDDKTPIRIPNGRLVTPGMWYQDQSFSRLPALVFFNEQGERVLETDALVLEQRMNNSLNFVLERAYEKGWTYQRFARQKGIERNRLKAQRASLNNN